MDLIHKLNHDNMVPDTLSRREEFQAMSTIQTLWLVYKGKGDLQRKTKKWYINDPKAQRLPSELRKERAFKDVKLVDGFLKNKQSWMYVP